jgi:hypothetical protein
VVCETTVRRSTVPRSSLSRPSSVDAHGGDDTVGRAGTLTALDLPTSPSPRIEPRGAWRGFASQRRVRNWSTMAVAIEGGMGRWAISLR